MINFLWNGRLAHLLLHALGYNVCPIFLHTVIECESWDNLICNNNSECSLEFEESDIENYKIEEKKRMKFNEFTGKIV